MTVNPWTTPDTGGILRARRTAPGAATPDVGRGHVVEIRVVGGGRGHIDHEVRWGRAFRTSGSATFEKCHTYTTRPPEASDRNPSSGHCTERPSTRSGRRSSLTIVVKRRHAAEIEDMTDRLYPVNDPLALADHRLSVAGQPS
ncbi:hypothetical protein GCM10009773_27280 [Williamsia serinedens]